MEQDNDSLYRDGLIVRARLPEQAAARAPTLRPKREPVEKPIPAKQNRVPPPSLDETVEVFVTRVSGQAFTWQVRRFGALVVREAQQTYPSAQLAREAGEAAMVAVA